MDELSEESKAIYALLKSATTEEYETRFLTYKKETLDAVRKYVTDTDKQIKTVNTAVESIRSTVTSDLEAAKTSIAGDINAVKTALSSDIASLTEEIRRLRRPDPGASSPRTPGGHARERGGGTVGPDGHCDDTQHRGKACELSMPPPVGGNHSDRQFTPSSSSHQLQMASSDSVHHGPRIELPQFDGANPKLWQRRCEEYFRRWQTPLALQVSYASSLFTGSAATWLEAFLEQSPNARWSEFSAAVMTRFGRNQHQILREIERDKAEAEQTERPPPPPRSATMPQPPLDNGKRTKGRQRRENVRVENKESRQVTFSKRKAGLWKKAAEIAVLCRAMIAIFVFSEAGKPFAFGSPSVDAVLDLIDDAPGVHALAAAADDAVDREAVEALYRETDEKRVEVAKEAARMIAIGKKVLELQKLAGKENWWEADVDALGLEELPVFQKSLERLRDNVRRRVDNLLAVAAQ